MPNEKTELNEIVVRVAYAPKKCGRYFDDNTSQNMDTNVDSKSRIYFQLKVSLCHSPVLKE